MYEGGINVFRNYIIQYSEFEIVNTQNWNSRPMADIHIQWVRPREMWFPIIVDISGLLWKHPNKGTEMVYSIYYKCSMWGCSYAVLSHACTPTHAAFGIIRKYSGIPTAAGSQPGLFSSFFMLWCEAIRCVAQDKHIHTSYFAPPCIWVLTSCSWSVNSLCFLNLLMDGCLYKQHSWLLHKPRANASSFLRALYFSSHQPLWKALHECACVRTCVHVCMRV